MCGCCENGINFVYIKFSKLLLLLCICVYGANMAPIFVYFRFCICNWNLHQTQSNLAILSATTFVCNINCSWATGVVLNCCVVVCVYVDHNFLEQHCWQFFLCLPHQFLSPSIVTFFCSCNFIQSQCIIICKIWAWLLSRIALGLCWN